MKRVDQIDTLLHANRKLWRWNRIRKLDLKIARSHYAFSIRTSENRNPLPSNTSRSRRSIVSASVEEEAEKLHSIVALGNKNDVNEYSIEIIEDVRASCDLIKLKDYYLPRIMCVSILVTRPTLFLAFEVIQPVETSMVPDDPKMVHDTRNTSINSETMELLSGTIFLDICAVDHKFVPLN